MSMWWWMKARRTHSVVLSGLALSLLLSVTIGSEEVELPSLVSGMQQAVLTMFVPIPLVAALMVSLESRLPGIEASSVRRVGGWDALLVSATVGFWFVLAAVSGSGVVAASARNAAFLAGLMLLARPWAGEAAVMVPVAWTMVVVAFNRRPAPDPEPWTILPEPASAPHAALAAAVLFGIGISSVMFISKDKS
ncbi:hypothetical protein [Streptomyces sp. AS02]|uniref:hypothetical protein n=1 Tax=Streptomyces sp. AS02 TaxID=2938946 RepID=UPI002020920D|nr:hypothetical protein [Streptomyces sp. AS02]MCL8016717.1 hypothetical protein [Streptomyces sp. AS02]